MPELERDLRLGPYTSYPDPRLASFLADESYASGAVSSARRPEDAGLLGLGWEHVQEGVAWLHGAIPWTGDSARCFAAELATIGLRVTVLGNCAEIRVDADVSDGPAACFDHLTAASPFRDDDLLFAVLALKGAPQLVGPDRIPVYRADIFGSMANIYLGAGDDRSTRLWRDICVAVLDYRGATYAIARPTFRRMAYTLLQDTERLGYELLMKSARRRRQGDPERRPVPRPKPGARPQSGGMTSASSEAGETAARRGWSQDPHPGLGSFVRYREPCLAAFLSRATPAMALAHFSRAAARTGDGGYILFAETTRQQLLQGHQPWTPSALLDAFIRSLRDNGLEVGIENSIAYIALAGDLDYGPGSCCEKLVQAAGFDAPHPRFLLLDIKGEPRLYGPRSVPIHEVDLVGEIYCGGYRRGKGEGGFRVWKNVFVAEFKAAGRSYLFAGTSFRRVCALLRRHEDGLRATVERWELERARAAAAIPEPPADDVPDEELAMIAAAF